MEADKMKNKNTHFSPTTIYDNIVHNFNMSSWKRMLVVLYTTCTLYNFFNDTESTESSYLPTATYMSLVIFLGLLRTVGQSLLYATVRDG